jgi:hypothetical protein
MTDFIMPYILSIFGVFALFCFIFYFFIPKGRRKWWAIQCPECHQRGTFVENLWKNTYAEKENILRYQCTNPLCWRGKTKCTYLYDFVWYRYIHSDEVDK